MELCDADGVLHRISAVLSQHQEGFRVVRKLDGRLRTGREVRAFLQAHGMVLDGSFAVIKQSQVGGEKSCCSLSLSLWHHCPDNGGDSDPSI